ncbi:inositol monophosphatase family protein [Actinomyces naeslundii]|uniref:inositol-phosphate phosphatase n=1 Tax=Actinomyces naeslundii TaxID=1655 RepID=A0AA47FEF2_ACTNA|nr:inositol monophosphatase [Actinomyces naeslundii]OMG17536.1 inositol monophosphatase [Actinomyces naeslundii]PKY95927.1 inositol monophosphatase [Actinomyces naeslundii]WAL41814.1 inositol monophosphatase [Actinomyces naeslundii]
MSASGDESKAAPTSSACLEDLLAQAVGAVRRAAAFALDPGEELRVEAKAHRNDLVTQVDRGVEARIASCLEATGIPIHGEEAHRVEDFETYRGRAWVLDPIDGTLNYVSTHRDWAISLALVDDGVPVLAALADPVAGRLYTAVRGRGARVEPLTGEAVGCDGVASKALEPVKDLPLSEGMVIAHYQLTQHAGIGRAIEGSRGMRCYGAAALEMAEVAAGGAVVYAQPLLQPWDVAAGALLCTETGAVLTRMDGSAFDVRRAGSLLVGSPAAHAEVLEYLSPDRC